MPPYAATTSDNDVLSSPLPSSAAGPGPGKTTLPISPSRRPVASVSLAAASNANKNCSKAAITTMAEPVPGAPVLTAFGLGTVHSTQPQKQSITVTLISWKLANDSNVLCYLRRSDVTVLAPGAMEQLSVAQKIEYAKLCKDLGVGAQQNGKLHGTALLLHQSALETTQAILKDCATQERPNLFLTMVKGHNHAASCALQLDLYRKARDHAKNAIAVLDALERKGQAQTQTAKPDAAASPASAASSASTDASTSSEDSAAIVGKVKLFGECRCKSLIFIARSYLQNPKSKQRHRDLAKNSLDQASAVIKKYSTKEYTSMPEMKQVLKQFVSHKRNITKYRLMARQQASSASTIASMEHDNTSYSTWFANKRVWFADDAAASTRANTHNKQSVTHNTGTPTATGWTQTAASAVAYTGFVALGAFMIHQVVVMSRKQ